MFGLMKATRSSRSSNNNYRLHYCGVCKAIGKNYGQSTRLFLNFDIVFLAELLGKIAKNQAPTADWDKAIHSYNCLNLPQKATIPISLQYAAALNVFLGKLKIKDNIADSKATISVWKAPALFLSKEFKRAEQQLTNWQLDIQAFYQLFETQVQREKSTKNTDYEHYALASAEMTAMAFQAGTPLVDHPEAAAKFYQFGFEFGKLVYLLDAFRDVEQDRASGQFNPFLLKKYPQNELIAIVSKQLDTALKSLQYLPLSMQELRFFADRLEKNTSKQLGLAGCNTCQGSCSKKLRPKLSPSEKWTYSKSLGKQATSVQYSNAIKQSLSDFILQPIFSFIFFCIPYYQLQSASFNGHSLPKLAILFMSSRAGGGFNSASGKDGNNKQKRNSDMLGMIYAPWYQLEKHEQQWVGHKIDLYVGWDKLNEGEKVTVILKFREEYKNRPVIEGDGVYDDGSSFWDCGSSSSNNSSSSSSSWWNRGDSATSTTSSTTNSMGSESSAGHTDGDSTHTSSDSADGDSSTSDSASSSDSDGGGCCDCECNCCCCGDGCSCCIFESCCSCCSCCDCGGD